MDLERAGFEVEWVKKLTTGPRALMFLTERMLDSRQPERRRIPATLHKMCRSVLGALRAPLHRFADRYYPESRVVPSDTKRHNIYVALLASARRSTPAK
jgi:hypothetical protein